MLFVVVLALPMKGDESERSSALSIATTSQPWIGQQLEEVEAKQEEDIEFDAFAADHSKTIDNLSIFITTLNRNEIAKELYALKKMTNSALLNLCEMSGMITTFKRILYDRKQVEYELMKHIFGSSNRINHYKGVIDNI